MRIVSLAPSATSIVCALGARRHLVGVTRWCKDIADVRGLPALGDCWKCDPDQVAKLKPDLVIGSVPYRAEVVHGLLQRNLRFVAKSPRTLEDIYGDIAMLGGLLGKNRGATQVIRSMKRRIAKIATQSRGAGPSPRVYCETWPKPTIASPQWIADLVELAGGRFVPKGKAGARLNGADILAADPEIIIIAWAASGMKVNRRAFERRPGWSGLRAVGEQRVFIIRDELLNTPSPVLVDGFRCIARVLKNPKSRFASSPNIVRLYP